MSSNNSRGQQGLTLIEFMISIVLGMVVVAAVATLIANQSTTRAEIDRAGRLIENGRYSIQTMVSDLQMAGYWGEITNAPGVPGGTALPDPCDVTEAGLSSAMGLHIQGYDGSTYTAGSISCVSNWKSGTDIVVVRYADPDYSAVLTGTTTDLTKLTAGQIYLQSGLTSATNTTFSYAVHASNSATNAANFPLVKKDGTLSPPRKVLVHIYYVASCDVCSGSVDTIPTLKRVELTVASGTAAMTTVSIAEGIENLQVEYGRDTDSDGAPDGTDTDCSAFTVASPYVDWTNTMSAKIYVLARATETTPGFTDTKSYKLGVATAASAPASSTGYQRRLFSQSVKLMNPSIRRSG